MSVVAAGVTERDNFVCKLMSDTAVHIYFLAVFGSLGAVVGSFLNVVIGRLPEELSVVHPRSRCPRCLTPIPLWNNVPILTWLILRGRCSNCGVHISPRYLLIELLTAVLAAALYIRFGLSWDLLTWAILSPMLIAIVFLDLDYWWIPDTIVLPGAVVAMFSAFLPGGLTPVDALLGLFPAGLIYATGWVFAKVTGREGLGFGDVKLLAMLGLALGLAPTLTLLFLASAQGVILGTLVTLFGGHRDRLKETPQPVTWALEDDPDLNWTPHPRAIPFGPFLALAAFEIVLLPEVFFELPQAVIAGWVLR